MLFCSVNGESISSVSSLDRGLAYGDGFFTTAKVVNAKVEMLNEHIERLFNTAIQLKINNLDIEKIESDMQIIASKYELAVLKVIVTAGSGGRGYSRMESLTPTVIISVHDYPMSYLSQYEEGISVGISKTKLSVNGQLSGLKHLNRLDQVLVKKDLESLPFDDLLVFNWNEHLIEASAANVFWFDRDEELYTPSVELSGVNGLMRQRILSHYPNTKIVKVDKEYLNEINSMFICNAVMGIMPVKSLAGRILDMKPVNNIRKTITK